MFAPICNIPRPICNMPLYVTSRYHLISSDARYMRVQKEQGICDKSHGSHGHNRYVRKLLPGKRCNIIIYNRNLRENLGEFW